MNGWSVAGSVGGLRGAGLGNQVIPMGKAWIAAQILGKKYIEMPWSLNPRGYRGELGVSRVQSLEYFGAQIFSKERIGEQEFIESGILDYADFISAKYDGISAPCTVVNNSGMVGGYRAIKSSREFLRTRLIGTSAALSNQQCRQMEKHRLSGPTVAIHVRAGDFADEPPTPGTFNRRIPVRWYRDVIAEIDATLHDYTLYLVTEPSGLDTCGSLASIANRARRSIVVSGSPTSDLSIMTRADLLVCSVSSFSMLAAFLSEGEYIWYAPHLTRVSGRGYIWPPANGDGLDAQGEKYASRGRGVPFPLASADFVDALAGIQQLASLRSARRDLLQHGYVRTDGGSDAVGSTDHGES